MNDDKPKARRDSTHIVIYVNADEKEAIGATARQCNTSLSDFGRTLMLGHEPVNVLDHEIALTLLKINADLGRLGGLLKLYLTRENANDLHTPAIHDLLGKIDGVMRRMVDASMDVSRIRNRSGKKWPKRGTL